MEFPIYLFTGFLEAGKTKFIQETLEDKRFNKGEKTLLLICEEGEEEYDLSRFSGKNVFPEIIENESDLTAEKLDELQKKHKAARAVVEYNGMWQLNTLYQQMPESWVIYQEFMFADATTFLTYNANMRSLVADKLTSCELVVFNRYDKAISKEQLHKIVRASSRKADIAYEYPDGEVEYDDIEDPLPFDVNAPVITIADGDYALWYRDLSENMKQYDGKKVTFKGVVVTEKVPAGSFIVGRRVMTCCEADIQYAGLVCDWSESKTLKNREWVTITASIAIQKHKAYGRVGPVLTAISVEPSTAPEQEVATFF